MDTCDATWKLSPGFLLNINSIFIIVFAAKDACRDYKQEAFTLLVSRK